MQHQKLNVGSNYSLRCFMLHADHELHLPVKSLDTPLPSLSSPLMREDFVSREMTDREIPVTW